MPMRRAAPLLLLALAALGSAQETLKEMPRYDRYARMAETMRGAVTGGAVQAVWAEDGRSFKYLKDSKWYRYDVAKRASEPTTAPETASERRGGRGPARGRQNAKVTSPDGKRVAESKDRNIVVVEDGRSTTITTDGSETARVKNGVASWVYGEELDVRDAMWWSPDSKRLAFYRFDESGVKDYYLATEQKAFQNALYPEAYPKAGTPNPKVDLVVRNLEDGRTTAFPINSGPQSPWEYAYDVRWSPDGKTLLFNRTNRKQNVMQLVAGDPARGTARVVAEERQPQSWAENHPTMELLADGHRFVWSTERNGYLNFELRDLDGRLLNPITRNDFDAGRGIVRIDEKRKEMFYMAAGPKNPYNMQLHVVGLDGKNDRLLTDPALDHRVSLAPDGETFTDVAQSPSLPPETRVVDRKGRVLSTIAKADRAKFDALGLKPTEVFTYLAADGKTTLYGTVQFPSDFDPAKRYPVLLSVYGGPESGGIGTNFAMPSRTTELGFLVVNLAGRGTLGRGKAFRDAMYGKPGIVEIDDQAAGIRALAERPYVDATRVGVYGTSYGGYATLMLLLRYPDVFAAGAASSSVTDYRNYDTIYTERYFGLPAKEENEKGYDEGSAVKLAPRLKGKLRIYFGSADDNVHPANTYQMVDALERADRRYEMQVGTDRGHTGMNPTWMLEFFMRTFGMAK